jgi:hypothetical protein
MGVPSFIQATHWLPVAIVFLISCEGFLNYYVIHTVGVALFVFTLVLMFVRTLKLIVLHRE